MLGELMQREIEEQPEALTRVAKAYLQKCREIVAGQSFDVILLVARGSSDHAALYARYLIEIHLGIPVVLAASSVLTRYGIRVRYPRCLAIGISQSGAAPDVAEVISAMRDQGHMTLAVTNTDDSRLTQEAEHTLLLDVGIERSVAATKTFTASLVALYSLVQALGAHLPRADLPTLDWSHSAADKARSHAARLVNSRPVFALGRGYSFSTANETALKLMECALIPCKAYSSADFEHGPKALAMEGSAVVAFGAVAERLSEQGCMVLQAPDAPVPEELGPVWQVVYGQWLALHCARIRGENPDEPQFIQKVTQTL